ncbi:MAG: hypothetical protein IPJ69_04980 [Deltaproteobacteria bacterium]|nr:MAG: hypothetical protein IPJ69_04980 [Deltaproteobacteria bacterium]
MYPTGRASTQLGAISGQILKSDGNPMMHVNVVARNEDDPLCETFSYLSGRVCPEGYERIGGNTCFRSSTDVLYATSNYTLSDLPTGDYYLEVEEIADNDIARTFAPGLADPYIYGDAEFWNTSDAADELSALKTSISLTSGVTREGINITLNRNEVTTNRIKYIPLSTFTPGLGTRCLENPTIDYAAMIGISEAGTSGSDNSGSGGSSVPPHFGGCSLVLK